MAQPAKQVIVLGGGVTGLQTALSLLTARPAYGVTLLATHFPGDTSIQYTSPLAGGHWRSHAGLSPSEAAVRQWDARTYEAWARLLRNGDEGKVGETYEERVKRIGLGFRESRNYWAKEGPETEPSGAGLWWKGTVEDFEVLDLPKTTDEKPPPGAIFGIKYKSICINVPQYLAYLYNEVSRLGARIVKASVDVSGGLEGAVRDAKRIVLAADGSESGPVFALVNATGLSARHIVGAEEASRLYPIRGQTVLVKGEVPRSRTYVEFAGAEDIAYVVPRPGSGTTIIGGCKQVGNWEEDVDQALNEKILETAKREGMAEEVRTGKDGGFEVISYQVGWRPGRKGGPRVELEEAASGKFDDTWLVHAYGHAGGGYQASVGSAERVVEILGEL